MGSLLVRNAAAVVTCDGPAGDRLRVVPRGAVLVEGERIAWVGPEAATPRADATLDAGGGLVGPGFVDAHTHVVFAGDRAAEFGARAAGATYQELLAKGGGILATVRATRAASEDELVALARPRLARLLSEGVTTAEAKGGYGLTVEDELKLLRAIRTLGTSQPVSLVATALPLHALPPEAASDRDAFVTRMLEELLPQAAPLCSFVDAFVEKGAFTADEARRLAAKARALGLGVRLHADQLSDGGGAALAAELGAATADHLEEVAPAAIPRLAAAGVAVTLLPISTLYLKCPRYAPGRALADAGVTLALGSNVNPGSAMTESFSLALGLACLGNGLSPAEAFLAATAGSAAALGLADRGRLAPGLRADLVVHGATSVDHLAYHLAVPHARVVLAGGRVVFEDRTRPAACT